MDEETPASTAGGASFVSNGGKRRPSPSLPPGGVSGARQQEPSSPQSTSSICRAKKLALPSAVILLVCLTGITRVYTNLGGGGLEGHGGSSLRARSLFTPPSPDDDEGAALASHPALVLPRVVSPLLKHFGINRGSPPDWHAAPKHRVIIDVGANDGDDYAVPAVVHGKHIVYAFEPGRQAAKNLLGRAEQAGIGKLVTVVKVKPGHKVDVEWLKTISVDRSKGHLFIIHAAAGRETGAMDLVMGPSDKLAHLGSTTVSVDFTDSADRKVVAVVRVDDVVDEDVYLLKSDAQGFDLNVLRGAERLFQKHRVEFLHTEFTPRVLEQYEEGSSVALLDFLSSHHFLCFDFASHRHIPIDRPSDFDSFTRTFFRPCDKKDGCRCQDDFCLHQSFGKWEELLCLNVS